MSEFLLHFKYENCKGSLALQQLEQTTILFKCMLLTLSNALCVRNILAKVIENWSFKNFLYDLWKCYVVVLLLFTRSHTSNSEWFCNCWAIYFSSWIALLRCFLRGHEKKIENITYLLTWHGRFFHFAFSCYLCEMAKSSSKAKMLPLESLPWMKKHLIHKFGQTGLTKKGEVRGSCFHIFQSMQSP